jgi:hypothetical protein
MFVFDRNRRGPVWKPLPTGNPSQMSIPTGWMAEFRHCRDGSVKNLEIETLRDLKDIPEMVSFAGIVIYRNTLTIADPKPLFLNWERSGDLYFKVNGKECVKMVRPTNFPGRGLP